MVPTVGGILLFGVDRIAHFPDAWIQAGRFAGVDKAIGRTPRSTRTRLVKLVSHGLVREVGTGPHDPKRRYTASRAALGGG